MTWAMISEENKINASKLIYSKQKNQIMQDFEEIKAEVPNHWLKVANYFFLYIEITRLKKKKNPFRDL